MRSSSNHRPSTTILILFISFIAQHVQSFSTYHMNNLIKSRPTVAFSSSTPFSSSATNANLVRHKMGNNDIEEGGGLDGFITSENDQLAIGVLGTTASLIVFYSEFVLKTTGCGLPAGPFGLVGAVEGISYLSIVAIGALSLFKKVKTGSGLPAGPNGLLGLAEGLSFLAIVAGLVVFGFQVIDYGYIPNAVPSEGSICK